MDPKIVFFMIITDPDIYIADYAIRSYRKITGLNFKLRIYSNYIFPSLKEKFFKKWQQFDFVDLIRNDYQDKIDRPSCAHLKGSFEDCGEIWDRELRKIQAPFYAQVHPDFEILNPRFIHAMLSRLESEPTLIAISTSGNLQAKTVFDTYSRETIIANPVLSGWFCIYKKESLSCNVSYDYYEENIETGPIRRNVWDSSGYFQRS